jgi:transposase
MAMAIEEAAPGITGGVDTHLDTHVAAALDPLGRLIGSEPFPADAAGYKALLRWLENFGEVTAVGVEGAGSYGTGLARFLRNKGIGVVEVNRPNRQARRNHGKSDPLDAIEAARAAPECWSRYSQAAGLDVGISSRSPVALRFAEDDRGPASHRRWGAVVRRQRVRVAATTLFARLCSIDRPLPNARARRVPLGQLGEGGSFVQTLFESYLSQCWTEPGLTMG